MPKPNLDFDEVFVTEDYMGMFYRYRWMKDRQLVHELNVSVTTFSPVTPLCPACFFWRADVQHMQQISEVDEQDATGLYAAYLEYRKQHSIDLVFRCPECKGEIDLNKVPASKHGIHTCSCGEIPHRISCLMGFDRYFSPFF